MNAVLWSGIAAAEMEAQLRRVSNLHLSIVDGVEKLAGVAPEMEALVIGGHFFSAEVAEVLRKHARRLRFIQSFTAGFEGLQAHGVPPGVVVANAGDSWSPAVAEHGMGLLLALVKQLPASLANQPRHAWDRSHVKRMDTLEGKTAAIVGFGSIGRAFARLARPFGMRIVGLSRSARADPLADEALGIDSLHTVLARSDVVVVAAPYTSATHRIIDARAFAACRKGALLINLARGGLVDTDALVAALQSGQLGGAGLDVTDPEPLPAGHPLWDCPNLIISPHMGGASGATGRERLARFIGENVARFAAGERPHKVVDLHAGSVAA